ncbi:choline-sulfatase [Primorskyibacter sedentarius]|uniref:Choline-sulfatase n=1 Tax=Primorskyibacter sedentarius TaxID=745311 RepID=A0A4R3J141_9RHOB|nr:choline-sulfatase [Primorskyibacter sedentarius]TCS59004.1 choline-sulfatase [Primorskyibacter sedentarius]
MTKTSQPNILLVMVDQMSHFVLPIAQPEYRTPHHQAIAPNIAALAKGGMTFTDCYTDSPLCAPARASIATGMHVREHGVCTNGDEFHASTPTFMHSLQELGYRTTVSGKTHSIGPDQLHGFDDRQTTDIYPSDFIWQRDWSQPVQHDPGTSVKKLSQSGIIRTSMQMNYDTEAKNRAVEFMQEHVLNTDNQPFMMMVSFTQPHEPFQALKKHWDLYDGQEFDAPGPESRGEGADHPYNKGLEIYHGINLDPPSDDRIKTSVRAHLAMISQIDDFLGEMMDALDRLQLTEDTIVVFTSDHGEMLGAHQMWFKRSFMEESAHVPLVMSWPGKIKPGVCSEPVSHVDIGPTLVDMAGGTPATVSVKWSGDSLKTMLLDGQDPDWRGTAMVDYWGDGTNTPMMVLREGDLKLAYFIDYEPVLFNLREDPYEMTNVASDPKYADQMASMIARMTDGFDPAAFKEEQIRLQKNRMMIQRARLKSDSDRLGWDYQPKRDPGKQYVRAAVNVTPAK